MPLERFVRRRRRLLPFWFGATLAASIATSPQAIASQCVAGHPITAYQGFPDANGCGCYQGSDHGTRVYAFVREVDVSSGSRSKSFDAYTSLSCDEHQIYVRTYDLGWKRVTGKFEFPIDARVVRVFTQGVTAVFPPLQPDSDLRGMIRNGNAVLVKIY